MKFYHKKKAVKTKARNNNNANSRSFPLISRTLQYGLPTPIFYSVFSFSTCLSASPTSHGCFPSTHTHRSTTQATQFKCFLFRVQFISAAYFPFFFFFGLKGASSCALPPSIIHDIASSISQLAFRGAVAPQKVILRSKRGAFQLGRGLGRRNEPIRTRFGRRDVTMPSDDARVKWLGLIESSLKSSALWPFARLIVCKRGWGARSLN